MKVTSFGEVLWDDFPSGKVLGGAPLNVLVRLSALGEDCGMISRCGDDDDGRELLRQMQGKNVATDWVQIDPQQATSLVKVMLNEHGSASYDIVYPCAWDRIEATEAALARVAQSDVFVFGSLSTRDEVSRAALDALLDVAKFKIFDVNLRQPHYQTDRVLALMQRADVIKLNDDELYDLATIYGSPYHSLAQHIEFLAKLTNTQHICVTLGGHGAVYYRAGEYFAHQGYRVAVADTVGAGDSFLAGFIHQLMQQKQPAQILDFACALGALVASRHGATPDIALQEIQQFMQPNNT